MINKYQIWRHYDWMGWDVPQYRVAQCNGYPVFVDGTYHWSEGQALAIAKRLNDKQEAVSRTKPTR